MALQFDVEPVIEKPLEALEHVRRRRNLTGQQQPADPAARAAGERKQTAAAAFEFRQGQRGNRPGLELEMGAADQAHQVEIALLVLDQQGQPVDRRQLAGRGDATLFLPPEPDVAAHDRLDSGFRSVLGELQGPEQVVPVRDGDGRHRLSLGQRHDGIDLVRPFRERIGGTDLEMNEIGNGHVPSSRQDLWTVRSSARLP